MRRGSRGSELPMHGRGTQVLVHDGTARRAVAAPAAEVTRIGFAPIVRVDAERREIELCATSEALDTYGTVFAYEASRDAFDRWAGNVREMHERRAVGRRVAVSHDDAERKVYVRVRISKGAQDTWEKVLDGTLRGASIGASNVEWRTERREGREVPVARRYDLVELSLVDLPSNPDALGVTFVRDGVPVAEVLDELEGLSPDPSPGTHTEDREDTETAERGRRPAGETVEQRIAREALARAQTSPPAPLPQGEGSRAAAWLAALGAPGYAQLTLPLPDEGNSGGPARLAAPRAPSHAERATAIGSPSPRQPQDESAESAAASELAAYCGMPGRQLSSPSRAGERSGEMPFSPLPVGEGSGVRSERAQGPYSNNPDGPPDTGVPARAEERPTADSYGQTPEGNREAVFHTAARGILLGCGCPACQAALAVLDPSPLAATEERGIGEVGTALVTRVLEAHARRLEASIQTVHGSVGQLAGTLGQIERRVAAIEAQPMPGGPQLRVADKTHALLPHGGQSGAAEQMRALEGLAGRLTDPQAQIAVATEMIRLQQEAAGLPPAMQAMPHAGSRANAPRPEGRG